MVQTDAKYYCILDDLSLGMDQIPIVLQFRIYMTLTHNIIIHNNYTITQHDNKNRTQHGKILNNIIDDLWKVISEREGYGQPTGWEMSARWRK